MSELIKGSYVYAMQCSVYGLVEEIDEDIGNEALQSVLNNIIPELISEFKSNATDDLKAVYLLVNDELVNILENKNDQPIIDNAEELRLFFVTDTQVTSADSSFMDISSNVNFEGYVVYAFFMEEETGSYVVQGYEDGEYDSGYFSELEDADEDGESLLPYMVEDSDNEDYKIVHDMIAKLEK